MDGPKIFLVKIFLLLTVLFLYAGCQKETEKTLGSIDSLILQLESKSTTEDNYLEVVDSLFLLSEQENSHNGKAAALHFLANYYYSKNDYRQTLALCDSSNEIAITHRNFPILIKNYDRIAKTYNRLRERDSSIIYFLKTAEISQIAKDSTELGKAYNNTGFIFWQGSKFDSAIHYFEKALEIRKKLNNKEFLSSTLNNMGTVYYQWQIFDRALEYYFQSLEIKKEIEDNFNVPLVLTNIGIVYKETNQPDKAIEYYKESIEYAKKYENIEGLGYAYNSIGSVYLSINVDSSIYYFNKSLETYKSINQPGGIIISLKGLGENYIKLNMLKEARETFNEILTIAETENIPLRIAEASIYLGDINLRENKVDIAKTNFLKAIEIGESHNIRVYLRDAYKKIAEVYEKTGDHSLAYSMFTKYDVLRNEIDNEETERNINELKSRFEFERFQREIDTERFKTHRQRDYLIAAGIFLFFACLLLIFVLRSNHKRGKLNKILHAHNSLIEKQSIELKDKNEELHALNLSKDKLFSIIAHDLRNPFFALINYSTFLKEDYSSLTEEEKEEYITNIYHTTASTYELLENLLNLSASRTGKITYKPIEVKIKTIVEKIIDLYEHPIKTKKLTVNNYINDENSIYADHKMVEIIFRNIINNAIKYSENGGQIDVSFDNKNGNATFIIKDNGIGMDEETRKNLFNEINITSQKGTRGEKGTGLGLSLCKEFVERNKGNIEVESSPGKGSSFYITLPVKTLNLVESD